MIHESSRDVLGSSRIDLVTLFLSFFLLYLSLSSLYNMSSALRIFVPVKRVIDFGIVDIDP